MFLKDLICKYFVVVVLNIQKLKRNFGLDFIYEGVVWFDFVDN